MMVLPDFNDFLGSAEFEQIKDFKFPTRLYQVPDSKEQ